jgi:hypothetical protein
MQTADFWSVPFGPDSAAVAPEAPPLLATVLAPVLAAGVTLAEPVRYDGALATVFARPLGRAWLSVDEQYQAASKLGLLPDPT